MDDDAKIWITLFICVMLAVVSISWSVAWYNVETTRSMMEQGYEQQIIHPGSTSTIWVKVKE